MKKHFPFQTINCPALFHINLMILLILLNCAQSFAQAEWRQNQSPNEAQGAASVNVKRNQTLENLIMLLSNSTEKSIFISQKAKKIDVTVFIENLSFDKSIQTIAEANDLVIVEDESTIKLMTRSEYMEYYAETEVLSVKHANPVSLAKILNDAAPELVEVIVDERSHSLVIRGNTEKIQQILSLGEELDKPISKKVFEVKYASVSSLLEAMKTALNIRGTTVGNISSGKDASGGGASFSLGSIVADERTNSLIVHDTPENLEICQSIIDCMDKPMEGKLFAIKYASAESIAEALRNALQLGDDSRGSIVVDPRSNFIVIYNIPEKIALCEKLIGNLDVKVLTKVFSTGNVDPQVIADQIRKGELGSAGAKEGGQSQSSGEATVQVLEGANQIIVTDTAERMAILEGVMREINQNISTKVLYPSNATPDELAPIITNAYPEVISTVDSRSNALIISGHCDRVQQAVDLVQELDGNSNIQVEIAAQIMLANTSKVRQIGLRIFGQDLDGLNETLFNVEFNPNFLADGEKPVGSTLGHSSNSPVSNPSKTGPNYLEVIQPNIQASAFARALASDGDTTLLANPRICMLIGSTSTIFSGTKEPYRETTFQNDQAVENVQFIDVGVSFTVTPLISPSNELTLRVSTEFSNVQEIRDSIPVVATQRAETIVKAYDGNTILLGGLINQSESNTHAGLPFLRRIPLLKYFFGEKKQKESEQELIIALTPHIEVSVSDMQTTRTLVPSGFQSITDDMLLNE